MATVVRSTVVAITVATIATAPCSELQYEDSFFAACSWLSLALIVLQGMKIK